MAQENLKWLICHKTKPNQPKKHEGSYAIAQIKPCKNLGLQDSIEYSSRSLLSILADFSSAVVSMVSILLISCSPSLFYRPLRTVPKAPDTIVIIVIFIGKT